MKKTITLTALLAVFGLIIFFSCNKTDHNAKTTPTFTDPEYPMDIRLAKKFYSKLKSETGNEVPETHMRRKGNNEQNRKYLLWKKAYEGETDSSTFVEVPMMYNRRPSDIIVRNNDASPIASANTILTASFDRLLISKNKKTGEVQVYIVTYIPDKVYLKGRQDISTNQINELEEDFSGYLKYRRWDGTPLFIQRVHQGKVKNRMVINKDDPKSPKSARQNKAGNARTTTQTCITYCDYEYVQNCYTSTSGEYTQEWCGDWYLVNVYCWSECFDDDPGDPGGGGAGGGGGGGGGGTSVPFVSINSVINNLTSPCFTSTFSRVTDARLKNFLTNLYMNTFVGMGKVHNLRIQEQANLRFQDVPVVAKSFKDPSDPTTWVIVLNSDYAHQGSEEAWAQTVLHELIHGFIKMNDLDFTSTSTWHEEHQQMLDTWVDRIRDALMDMYDTHWFEATGLALGGIEDVIKQNEASATFMADMNAYTEYAYNISLSNADQMQENYTNGTAGKRCP